MIAAFLSGILIGTVIGMWFSWNALAGERDRLQKLLDQSVQTLQQVLEKTESK